MLKVRKPTGPIANKPMPQGSRWKTYWGKFITFRKDDRIYYVLFKYSFLRGVYDISITTSYKQKAIAEKSGLDESKLCMSLQGKRKLEAGEYANICSVLGVPMTMFVKPKIPEKEVV